MLTSNNLSGEKNGEKNLPGIKTVLARIYDFVFIFQSIVFWRIFFLLILKGGRNENATEARIRYFRKRDLQNRKKRINTE